MSNLFYDEGQSATGKKVMLATPSYDSPSASYTYSIARSREALTQAGIQSAYLLLSGHCHVDDSRNAIVRNFLESDCTDLVFLDADVDWEPNSLVQLCKREHDIIGGVYPYRRDGSENMPVRLKEGAIPEDGILEVKGLPTGFMKIKRHVLEKMSKKVPVFFDKIYETHLMFDRPTPGEDKTRWGGDIDFCNRWCQMGGKIYADMELRLGHVAKIILKDSLGAHLRRVTGTTFKDLIPRFINGTESPDDYNEIFQYGGNKYAADAGVLALCVGLARKCMGPIIETGSGLSSVMMGAVTNQKVYSLEHIDHYASQTVAWAEEAGVSNTGICYAPLKDLWYDVDKFDLPNKFALGFCDGPPRFFGTRMKFFEVFGQRCSVIAVDDVTEDHNYSTKIMDWAKDNGRNVTILGRAALITKSEHFKVAA